MVSNRIFLTAEWRHLVMLNYEVEPDLLTRFVPRGMELDCWNGKTFLSLVGFRFLETKVFGWKIPVQSNFDEVNLRFYVRRIHKGELRRGVVFIREIVPRFRIAFVARAVYNENYVACPMAHEITSTQEGGVAAVYRWRSIGAWSEIRFKSQGNAELLKEGSQEQFITEHYWGYAAQRDGGCVEYEVIHPPWKVWQAGHAEFRGDMRKLSGQELGEVLQGAPASAFLADGSEVAVMRPVRL